MGMRIAVLVKQVPQAETLELLPTGRLRREGLDLELNAYCRRAVAKGIELAREHGGHVVVFTLGPPAADSAVREALAWARRVGGPPTPYAHWQGDPCATGAVRGVHLCDPAFAGSDTLATARALAAGLEAEGPFDLVLAGRNSVDADTGQVGPELAELLGLPFAGGVRELELNGEVALVRCELDEGSRVAEVSLPAVLSVAERLCSPAKVEPEHYATLPDQAIRRVGAADLGRGPWGAAGSPTAVGATRLVEVPRRHVVLDGPVETQVERLVDLLCDWDALADPVDGISGSNPAVPHRRQAVPGGPELMVLAEPGSAQAGLELLSEASRLAGRVGGSVVVVGTDPSLAGEQAARGADRVVVVSGALVEEDVAAAVTGMCHRRAPWAVLAPGTLWGREVASRVAAALQAGLVGDAVELDVEGDRLVCWKPAFGGRLVAAITFTSQIQLATVRPGAVSRAVQAEARGAIRSDQVPVDVAPVPVDTVPVDTVPLDTVPLDTVPVDTVPVEPRGRVRVLEVTRDEEVSRLLAASTVVALGAGVDAGDYTRLEPLVEALGAELAASRKVTDKSWLPRARQVGLTGHSLAPRLYVALGLSGKFNHMVGVRSAGTVVAINSDPEAPVRQWADVTLVADWREAVPLLADAVRVTRIRRLVPERAASAGGAQPGR